MAHVRQQIRERIATTLTGLTTTGTNVFQSRVYPMQEGELPGLCIYTIDEEADLAENVTGGSQRSMLRTLRVGIDAYVQDAYSAGIDDTIDTIASEIETALANDTNVNDLAIDAYLTNTQIQYEGGGKQAVAIMRMTYLVRYMNQENAPETAL